MAYRRGHYRKGHYRRNRYGGYSYVRGTYVSGHSFDKKGNAGNGGRHYSYGGFRTTPLKSVSNQSEEPIGCFTYLYWCYLIPSDILYLIGFLGSGSGWLLILFLISLCLTFLPVWIRKQNEKAQVDLEPKYDQRNSEEAFVPFKFPDSSLATKSPNIKATDNAKPTPVSVETIGMPPLKRDEWKCDFCGRVYSDNFYYCINCRRPRRLMAKKPTDKIFKQEETIENYEWMCNHCGKANNKIRSFCSYCGYAREKR